VIAGWGGGGWIQRSRQQNSMEIFLFIFSADLLDFDIVLCIFTPNPPSKPLPTACTIRTVRKEVPQIENPQTCGLPDFVRFADLPQKRQFADLRLADPIFFAICGFVICDPIFWRT
jgi:hypothetical protein